MTCPSRQRPWCQKRSILVDVLYCCLAGLSVLFTPIVNAQDEPNPPARASDSSSKERSSRQAEKPDRQAAGDDDVSDTADGGDSEGSKPDGDKPKDGLGTEESLARFGQLLERRPLHAAAFNDLVRHYADQGKLSDLVKDYEQKVAAVKEEISPRIVLARLYLRAGQPEKAAEIIDKLGPLPAAFSRDESKWLVFKSEVYQRTNRLDAAQEMLQQALQQAKSVSERLRLSEGVADLFIRAGQRDKAAEALTQLAREFPDTYLHRKRIADSLAQRELHAEAAEQYRQILPLVEKDAEHKCEVLRQLGASLERLGKQQEAIDAYTQAVNLLSGGHWLQQEIHERIVNLYRASGRLDELIRYCREQVDRAPQQTALRGLLADVLAAGGDVDGAKSTLAEAVKLFPADKSLSQRRIAFLERVADADGVSGEYERIISQVPDDIELYIAYGQFLANNKQLEAARNQWKHVLSGDNVDATLAQRLGSLFEPYELFDDAAECYERAIKAAPQRPESYASLARLWFFRGDKEKALAALARMAEANPDDASTHATRCQALLGLGLADEALAAIRRACDLAPDRVEYLITQADLLIQLGKLDDSLKLRRKTIDAITNAPQQAQAISILVSMYSTAGKLALLKEAETEQLKTSPNDGPALLLLARAADVEHDFPAERGWLNALLESDPSNEEGRRQMARLLEATGDVDGAVAAYRTLIEQHPARGRQYYQSIADLKLRYNDKAGALETFDKMVQASPGNATVLKEVAEQLVRIGEVEKAVSLFEESLRAQPDRHEVRLAYGKALFDSGRLEDALAAFKEAALQKTDHDTSAEALAKLHETAAKLGTVEDLLEDLQSRIEADPDNVRVAQTLAELYIREFEYSRAMDLLDLVLRHQPRAAELLLVKAELLRRLARFDDALDIYRRVLRFPDIDRDFLLGEMGKTSFENGRTDQARATWRQINHKLYAGTLLRNNGLVQEAIEVFQEGIRLKPDDYGLHRNLIRAYQAAGKTDEALECARRLLDLEPDNVFNIKDLAKAYLDRGDRKVASQIAGRLFGADVAEKQGGGQAAASNNSGGMPLWAMSMQAAWGWGQAPSRSNLDGAIQFFKENGLNAELEEILEAQLTAQPDNAVLRDTAVNLFSEDYGKPERALALLKELETASFPLEYQSWLGQCSQRDFMRTRQYRLIAGKPALRDQRLAALEAKPDDSLTRDEMIEFAVVRQALGATDRAIELLKRALQLDKKDEVALSGIVDTLSRAERFKEAEPYTRDLVALLGEGREALESETLERVRRDFVRTLPVQMQLRVTDELLRDVAHKWTLGQTLVGDYLGGVQTLGYYRAQLTLATICAHTERPDEAREIWRGLAPRNPADADGWTMLAGVVQLHGQQDLAYEFYSKALGAARLLAADPLLQRIYSGSVGQYWFGRSETIDSSFNKIVEAFAGHDKLIELYDFLRETGQVVKARRVAEQYELYPALRERYARQFDEARAKFHESGDDAINRSVPLLMAASKLAEVCDRMDDWPAAQKTYLDYLSDFPDELALLTTFSEIAESGGDLEKAVEWERKAIDAKERLSRKGREWSMREVYMVPERPRILDKGNSDSYEWSVRWGQNTYYYWGNNGPRPLEAWPSWLRIAQLYLAMDNPVAAGSAMERAISVAGGDRDSVAGQVLSLIRQRQLVGKMLTVLRSLAVQMPTEESIQLAFAESLTANDRKSVAAEVYRRMLRRGVSNVSVLAQVRSALEQAAPDASEAAPATLASLEADVKADSASTAARLRLAKAYFYSLDLDKALEQLTILQESAPHLEGLHDLLIEIHTVRGDTDRLIEALQTKIKRVSDDQVRNAARSRLASELFTAGRTDEALAVFKELADPKDPNSYDRIGVLLQYFGRHAEAIECFEQSERNRSSNMTYGRGTNGSSLASALAIKGDFAGAAAKVLAVIDQQTRQMQQYGGMYAAYSMFTDQTDSFGGFAPLMLIYPEVTAELERQLLDRQKNAADAITTKLLMQFYKATGRPDRAEAMVDSLEDKGAADQSIVTSLIQRAVERQEYEKAIKLATNFISQQSKPTLPPGIPAEYAGMMLLMSPRNVMLCQLGDIYWKMNDPDKAFASYREIIDEKVDDSRLAYAAICMMRNRVDEARTIVNDTLDKQKVKSPKLLQFRAVLSALENKPTDALEALIQAADSGGDQTQDFYGDGGDATQMLASFAAQTGQLDRFIKYMQERIKKSPNKWTEYSTLANALRSAGRMQESMDVLRRASEVKSVEREAVEELTKCSDGRAPRKDVMSLYARLIALAERAVKPKSGMLSRMFGGGGGDDAPIDTQKWRNRLGNLQWDAGDHESAVRTWAERMNLNQVDSHVRLATLYLEKQDFEHATECLQKALKLSPNHVDANRSLAELAFQSGDVPTALNCMREVFLATYRPADSGRGQYDSDYDGYPQGYSRMPGYEINSEDKMRVWALELSRKPEVASRCTNPQSNEDRDIRLMLQALVGDWDQVAAILKERMSSTPYDPLVWSLAAVYHERRGEWEDAIQAWERIRRLSQTSLPQHREELQLVLAGRQVKEAAAGIKDAQAAAGAAATAQMPIQRYQYYSQYDYGYGRNADQATQRLATLNMKLGRFEAAERLYLLSAPGGSARSLFPSLAALIWQQGGRERAAELMRMTGLFSNEYNFSDRLASVLAEAGQMDAAIGLLTRAYLAVRSRTENYGIYAMYGGVDSHEVGEAFEDASETTYATQLYDCLNKAGRFETFLTDLKTKVADHPDDTRLTKLILSLELRDNRWKDAAASLAAWRKARPYDRSAILEEYHVKMQLRDWDGAIASVRELQKRLPAQNASWCMYEAFVHLMRGDGDAAVAAIEPVLSAAAPENVEPEHIAVVLAQAGKYNRLIAYLELKEKSGELSDETRPILTALYMTTGKWDAAVSRGLKQLWEQSAAFDESSDALRELSMLVRGATDAKVTINQISDRPEDAAMVTLLDQGPDAGLKAFEGLVATSPESLNARRGLILAAMLAGRVDLAIDQNTKLVEWLGSRRGEFWYAPPVTAFHERVKRYLEQIKTSELNSQSVLGMGMSFDSVIQQFIQSDDDSGGSSQVVTYDELWNSHRQLQQRLAMQGGHVEKLSDALMTDAELAAASRVNNEYGYNSWSRSSYSSRTPWGFVYSTNYDWQNNSSDWRARLRGDLMKRRLFGPLRAEFEKLGSRLPQSEWFVAAEALAADGESADSERWRKRAADADLVGLRGGDAPDVDSTVNSYWYWYGSENRQKVQSIRSAMQMAIPRPVDDANEQASSDGNDSLTVDDESGPRAEFIAEIPRLEATVGPGWIDSQTVQRLVWHWEQLRKPDRVITTIERAAGPDSIVDSNMFSNYLKACVESNDLARMEKMLELVQKRAPALETEIQLTRLAVLRRVGKKTEADELESKLVSRCKQEARPACRIDARLTAALKTVAHAGSQMQAYARQVAYENYRRWNSLPNWRLSNYAATDTAPGLAQSIGIQFRAVVSERDCTLARIVNTYARYHLHQDASRVIGMRLSNEKAELTDRERIALLTAQAIQHGEAGDKQAAAELVAEIEQYWAKKIAETPYDPGSYRELLSLYQSKAAGPDHAKTLQVLTDLARLDPSYDRIGSQRASCLFDMGNYKEAWDAYQIAIRRGELNGDAGTLFKAGISAGKAGARQDAVSLIRQAVWRAPQHKLAKQAGEWLQ